MVLMTAAAERSFEASRSSLVDVAVLEHADLTIPLLVQSTADAPEALAAHGDEVT
jgi:hypothetical protein